jgi:hypothetical protein
MDTLSVVLRGLVALLLPAQADLATLGSYSAQPAFILRVDEVIDFGSQIYVDKTQTNFVLLSSLLASPMVVDLRTGSFTVYGNSEIIQNLDGKAVWLSTAAKPASSGTCKIEGATVVCRNKTTVVIEARPQLIGEVSTEKLYANSLYYKQAQISYLPDPKSIESIHRLSEPIEIRAYFGTWSYACRELLPEFLAVITRAANPKLTVRLIAVNKELDEPSTLLAGIKITSVPTFSIYRNGKVSATFSYSRSGIERRLARLLASR